MSQNKQSFLQRFIRKIGYQRIQSENEVYGTYNLRFSREIAEDIAKVKDHSMLSYLKLATLYEQVEFLERSGLEGSLVECGVWKGGSVGMMALANLKFGRKRRDLHLFDAFDDICEPNPEIDGEQALIDIESLLGSRPPIFSGKLEPIKGIYDKRGGHGTVEGCKNLLVEQLGYDEKKVFIHKGWFQKTLPRDVNKIRPIALLRLDSDWYESTKVCLEYLYDKVVNGGFVIIDDYGRYDGCKKAVDEFFLQKGLKTFLHYADYNGGECRYFIKN